MEEPTRCAARGDESLLLFGLLFLGFRRPFAGALLGRLARLGFRPALLLLLRLRRRPAVRTLVVGFGGAAGRRRWRTRLAMRALRVIRGWSPGLAGLGLRGRTALAGPRRGRRGIRGIRRGAWLWCIACARPLRRSLTLRRCRGNGALRRRDDSRRHRLRCLALSAEPLSTQRR